MSKRTRASKPRATSTSTSTAIVPAAEPTTIVPSIPDALTPADVRADGIELPDGITTWPSFVNAMVAGFRAVATMPTSTRDERAAVVRAFNVAADAVAPVTSEPTGRNTGRYGHGVFESQNALYVAMALCGVPVNVGIACAAWRAVLPNAKCDYLGTAYDRAYPVTTLSEFANGGHGDPVVPMGRTIVNAWRGRFNLATGKSRA